MVRSATTVRNLSLIAWFAGALILGVGFIRFVRAIELNRPASLLIFEMLFVGLVVSMYTAVFVTRTYYIWRIQDRNFTEMSI